MGSRKLLKEWASSLDHSYFSTRTSNRPQGFNLVMCRRSPGGKTHLKFNLLLHRHNRSLFAVVNHNNTPPHFSQQLDKHVPVYMSKVKQVNRFSYLETTHTHNHSIKTAHKVYYLTNFNKDTFPSKALVCIEEQQTTSCLKESQPSINYAHPPAEGSAGGWLKPPRTSPATIDRASLILMSWSVCRAHSNAEISTATLLQFLPSGCETTELILLASPQKSCSIY